MRSLLPAADEKICHVRMYIRTPHVYRCPYVMRDGRVSVLSAFDDGESGSLLAVSWKI